MKLIHITLFACLLVIAGCADNAKNDSSEVVEKYLAAVSSNDYESMANLLADGYVGYGPSIIDSTNKEQAIQSWKWNNENLYESINFEFSELLPAYIPEGRAQGNWVSNWAQLTVKYKDGRGPVNLWLNAVYKVEDGKIVRSRTFYNEADVYAQLGYRIFPPLSIEEDNEPNN